MRLEFPSPIGELHFSIRLCERRNEREKIIVSVPYRGATFLNFCISTNYRSYPGFRPLSGSYISQFWYRKRYLFFYIVSVPYRGATFLNHFLRQWLQWTPIRGFRPLSGSYISQLKVKSFIMGISPVSVPYRGATFLNTIPATPCPVWDE